MDWACQHTPAELRAELLCHHTVVADTAMAEDVDALIRIGMPLSSAVVYAPDAVGVETMQTWVAKWVWTHRERVAHPLVALQDFVYTRWWRLPPGVPRRLLHDQCWLPLDAAGKDVAIVSEAELTPEVLVHMTIANPRLSTSLYRKYVDKIRQTSMPMAPRKPSHPPVVPEVGVVLDFVT
jgi:hypothetical protein